MFYVYFIPSVKAISCSIFVAGLSLKSITGDQMWNFPPVIHGGAHKVSDFFGLGSSTYKFSCGIVFKHQKVSSTDVYYNMSERQKHAKQEKPDTNGLVLCEKCHLYEMNSQIQ